MILLTDIGRDIDDAVALVYAVIKGVPLRWVITTSKDAVESANICKNIIEALADKYPKARDIKIIPGSTEPRKHGSLLGNHYKGEFSKGHYKYDDFDPLKLKKSDVISIGPTTDLLKLMENDRVKRVLYMGQCKKDGNSIEADMDAYNFRCDPYSSEACFQYQDRIPFAFIGKTLAYRVPLYKDDFNKIADTKHPVGEFLKDHAFTSYEIFKDQGKELYEKLYKGTDRLSFCYDPLTILSVVDPKLFIFEAFGKHRIGVDVDGDKARSAIISTIINGLTL